MLSQGKPPNAVGNFDTYLILQLNRRPMCGFPATAQLSCCSVSADCSESSITTVIIIHRQRNGSNKKRVKIGVRKHAISPITLS